MVFMADQSAATIVATLLKRIPAILLMAFCVVGCASTAPYIGQGPTAQITRGAPVPPVDFIGNVLSLPGKLILWDWQFNSHSISALTEQQLVAYRNTRHLPAFERTAWRLNEYTPLKDLGALVKNRDVAWPYRLLFGLPTTLITDVFLPGRIFPWGDYYNAYTNTIHLYSDDVTIALHESGHAYDFAAFPHKGTYATLRLVPFMDLYQEARATDEAINYLVRIEDRETEFRAYRVLWPAYGTYIGAYVPVAFGSAAGALFGHIAGRTKVAARKNYYKRMDTVLHPDQSHVEEHKARSSPGVH